MGAIGQRLRERREAARLTGREVTERGGPDKSYLSQLESGSREPNAWPTIALLARLYETSTDYLLGLVDDPAPAAERDWPEGAQPLLTTARRLSIDGRLLLGQIAEALLKYEEVLSLDMAAFDFAEGLLRLGANEEERNKVVEILELSVSDPAAARELALRSFPAEDILED